MGEKIRIAIDTAGISVEKLAEKLGVTVQSVYRWLRNEVTPNVATIRQIARITDRPVYYFISEAAPETLSRKLGTITVSIDGERVFTAPVKRSSDIDIDVDDA